jgi:predicted GIY-YIG superfamily endonuclease
MKYIYLIQCLEDGRYKIGISKHPEKRLTQLQTGSSGQLKLIDKYLTGNYFYIEGVLHRRFSHFKKMGEWFDMSIKEECEFTKYCKEIEDTLLFLKKNNSLFI